MADMPCLQLHSVNKAGLWAWHYDLPRVFVGCIVLPSTSEEIKKGI